MGLPSEDKKPDWKRYVDNQGLKCPYCGSVDLACDNLDADGGYAHQDIECNGCGREWQDVYRLVDVNVDGGPANADEPVPDDHPDSQEN